MVLRRRARSQATRVLVASSAGTVFEWFDFFLYGALAVLFAVHFFPPGNETAALLASLAAFGAGFVVRPLGALVFGRLGDLLGRHRIFFWTLALMGAATFAIGLLPTYAEIGLWAPALLVLLRLVQGLAVGGEFGAASTYVAEHAPPGHRGLHTSIIQGTGTVGLVLALLVVLACRLAVGEEAFRAWGWRLPFLLSLGPLLIALYIRLKLEESPLFAAIRAAGKLSKAPLQEVLATPVHRRRMLLAFFCLTVAQGVIWHAGQFYPLLFLQGTLKLDTAQATFLVSTALMLGMLLFPFAGWLADRLGRRPVLIAGFVATLIVLFPAYHGLARALSPDWHRVHQAVAVELAGAGCSRRVFGTLESDCERLREALARAGVRHRVVAEDGAFRAEIGGREIAQPTLADVLDALRAEGLPERARPGAFGILAAIGWILVLMLPVALVCGPAAIWMLELFPTRVRYTALGLPYTLGNGWFGGFTSFATATLGVALGDPFAGLWYAFALALFCLVCALLLMPETRDVDFAEGLAPEGRGQ